MNAVWSALAEQRGKAKSERRVALSIAVGFAAAGIAWVLLTDLVLYRVTADRALLGRFETAKGWMFVLLAAGLIYVLAYRSSLRLVHARAAMAAVVDSIADGLLLLGRDRHIAYANRAAARMLGYDDEHALVGMDAREFSRRFRVSYMDGSLVPPDEFVSQRVYDEGGPLRYKATIQPARGRRLIISVVAAAVRLRSGVTPEMVVSVMHDITDAENLEQLRNQFFAAAAHALKTPVAVIKANAQMLSRAEPAQVERSTAAIERQCGRMDRLVQNLLVLARARSRTLQLHFDEVELAPLVEKVAREMAVGRRGIEIRSLVTAAPRVLADPERLALVLRNVIDDALRGSDAGTSVTVRLDQHGEDAEIVVGYHSTLSDEGGLSFAGEYDVMGIGRSVATTIVEAHGGALRDERSGADASAHIRLPVSVETAP
jgi:PAS domain S-box-containing protein